MNNMIMLFIITNDNMIMNEQHVVGLWVGTVVNIIVIESAKPFFSTAAVIFPMPEAQTLGVSRIQTKSTIETAVLSYPRRGPRSCRRQSAGAARRSMSHPA